MNTSASQQSIQSTQNTNKRYIILTYCVEFDKVHYPLPLNFQEIPDLDSLKATIRRLRIENEELKKQGLGLSDNNNSTY